MLDLVGYEARENDSRLYTRFVKQLSEKPLSHVIALEWQGLSPYRDPNNPYVRDHLVGQFIPSVILTKMGWDWKYSHYTINQLYRFLIPWLFFLIFSNIASRQASLFVLVAMHLNPMALNYGLRANQEQPLVLALALALLGYFNLKKFWGASALYLGSLFGFLVKGISGLTFFPFWGIYAILFFKKKPRELYCLLGLALFLGASALVYEFWFRSVTGHPFWEAYFNIQVFGRRQVESTLPFSSLGYYLSRSVGYSLPWVIGLIFLYRGQKSEKEREVISLFGLLSFGVILIFGYFGRKASRYIFPVYYFISCLGALGFSKKIKRELSVNLANLHLILFWGLFLIQFLVYCYKGKTYII